VIGALAGLALASGALSLAALSHVVNAALALAAADKPIALGRLVAVLRLEDLALAAVTLVLVGVVAWWEWRGRAVSHMLSGLDPRQGFAVLTIVVAWCGQAYLFPGVLLGGDTGSHIARFLEMRRGFDAGAFPQWTNYDYLGSSLLGFTGPLTYIIGGAVDVVVRDPVATAKLMLFCSHLVAGWVFWALLLRLGFAALPALVAAIAFAGSFALLHLFLYRGVFPQQFTIIFLAVVFYAAEGLMRGLPGRGRDWLIFALSTAGLIVNHQPHALFCGLYLGLFGAASVACGRWQIRRLGLLASAGIMGVAISVFAVIPILAEADWVMIDPEGRLLGLQAPTLARLFDLVVWRDWRTTWGTDYWAYVGIVCVTLAFVGGWAALSHRLGDDRRALAVAALPCMIASFFLHDPVVRDIIFIVFFAALYAALGMEWIAAQAKPGSRIVLIVSFAAVLDVASTSIQPVARTDKGFLIDAGRYLEAEAANQRILEVEVGRDKSIAVNIGPSSGPISFYSTVERVAGHHNMAATRVHNYAETIAKLAERDLHRAGRLSPETESLVGLVDVTRIVCLGSFAMGCPARFAATAPEPPLGAVVRVPDAAPAVFGRTLVALAPPPGLDKPMLWSEFYDDDPPHPQVTGIIDFLHRYLRAMRIDPATDLAAAIPVRSLPDGLPPPASDAWHPRMTAYQVGLQRVAMTVVSDAPGYVQLSHPWFPASQVRINGLPVAPLEGAIDLTVVPIAAGENAIEIGPVVTPVRAISNIVSAVSIALAFAVAGGLGLRRGPSNSNPN
jgi:hypothetical protein